MSTSYTAVLLGFRRGFSWHGECIQGCTRLNQQDTDMRTIEQIRRFKTRNFSVHVNAVEDSDIDLSWDDDGTVMAGLESGRFQAFGVVVTVYCRGAEVGTDSLWNCIYESPRAFMDHVGIKPKGRADGRNYGSYFSDMVRTAIGQARKHVADFRSIRVRC